MSQILDEADNLSPHTSIPTSSNQAKPITSDVLLNNWKLIQEYLQLWRIELLDPAKMPPPSCQDCTITSLGGPRLHICLHCAKCMCQQKGHLKLHLDTSPDHLFAVEVFNDAVYCSGCSNYIYHPKIQEVISNARYFAVAQHQRLTRPSETRIDFKDWTPSADESQVLLASQETVLTNHLRGLRGLHNLGNTCFMNVVLQSISANPLVSSYFLADQHNRSFCGLNRQGRFCLACETDHLVESLFSGQKTPWSPHQFLYTTWKCTDHLAGYDQQDAHDFYISTLNAMHTHIGESKLILRDAFKQMVEIIDKEIKMNNEKSKNNNVAGNGGTSNGGQYSGFGPYPPPHASSISQVKSSSQVTNSSHNSSEMLNKNGTSQSPSPVSNSSTSTSKTCSPSHVHSSNSPRSNGNNESKLEREEVDVRSKYLKEALHRLSLGPLEIEELEGLTDDSFTDENCSCITHKVFAGFLRSDVHCLACHSISTAKEAFLDISVDLGHLADPSSKTPLTLPMCLSKFTQIETLESFNCASCHANVPCTKQLSIDQLPLTLCFHLKRFRQTITSTIKIETYVQFPLHLDMTPFTYMATSETATEDEEIMTPFEGMNFGPIDNDLALGDFYGFAHPFSASRNNNNNNNNIGPTKRTNKKDDMEIRGPTTTGPVPPSDRSIYSLFAVINHSGNMDNGHYTCHIRHSESWYKCDDHIITRATVTEVLQSRAYLLFYCRSLLDYHE